MTYELGHLVLGLCCSRASRLPGIDDILTLLAPQSELPCLTPEGRLIMETRSRIAMAPDGNGGVYTALDRCHHTAAAVQPSPPPRCAPLFVAQHT